MRVRRLNNNLDWTFGQGTANYLRDNDAILQNVSTRLKSFKFDWILDSEANIDWFNILGIKDNEDVILREVERVTLETDGVIKINNLEISKTYERSVIIQIDLETIFAIENKIKVEL